jgi:hypothetical protein
MAIRNIYRSLALLLIEKLTVPGTRNVGSGTVVSVVFHYYFIYFAEWTTDQRRQSVRYWIVLDELVPSLPRRPPLKSFRPPPCLERPHPLSPPSTSPARLSTSTLRQASGVVLWNRNYFYGSGCDFRKVTVPVPTFDKLRFRFRLHRYL